MARLDIDVDVRRRAAKGASLPGEKPTGWRTTVKIRD